VHKAQANVETILADLYTQVIPVLEAQYTGLKIEAGQKLFRTIHFAKGGVIVSARNISHIQSLSWIKIQSDH
jgi:hypothetical protein